jgi:YD repeat-containing protein
MGNITSYGYDATGNRVSVTNANRQPLGAPESGSQCGASGTGDGVDDDGDGKPDDGCPSTKYAYDALNRLTSTTDPLGRVTSYQYDAASNLVQRTDARALITRYVYDALNRMTRLDHYQADGTTLVDSVDYAFTPDKTGHRLWRQKTGRNRRISAPLDTYRGLILQAVAPLASPPNRPRAPAWGGQASPVSRCRYDPPACSPKTGLFVSEAWGHSYLCKP